jgi:Trk-type K+ transport system membrane component
MDPRKSLDDTMPIIYRPTPALPPVIVVRSDSRPPSKPPSRPQSPAARGVALTAAARRKLIQFQILVRHRDERDALSLLLKLSIAYWVGFTSIGFFFMGFYQQFGPGKADMRGLSPWWTALFHTSSAFANNGLALWQDNVVPMRNHPFLLVIMGSLIVVGNTGFPVAFRVFVYLVSVVSGKLGRRGQKTHRLTQYILKYSRRISVQIYPAKQTLFLFVFIIATTSIMYVVIMASDWSTFPGMTPTQKVFNYWFQVMATRTGGFSSIDVGKLAAGTLVLFAVMMYIGVIPGAVALRSSRSPPGLEELATAEQMAHDLGREKRRQKKQNAMFQLKRLILFDSTWLYAPWFLIAAIESKRYRAESASGNFTIFKIFFEIASAYGTVGLTMGYTGVVYSFCGVWSTLSKFITCVVMMMGRHRSFPDRIDQALVASLIIDGAPEQQKELQRTASLPEMGISKGMDGGGSGDGSVSMSVTPTPISRSPALAEHKAIAVV